MYIILDTNKLKKLSPAEMQEMILKSDQDTFKALSEVIENVKIQNELSSKKKRYIGKGRECKGL